MEDVIVRAYCPGDETGILALYREVFEVDIALKTWQWTYQDNPDGPAIMTVAQSGDRIVGHYGVQPRPFWLDGQPCLAGLTVGTMVHPCARNLKTFVDLAQLAYELSRQSGMQFLYSFSRDDAWKVRQVVLGWQALPQLTAWEGSLQPCGLPNHPIEVYPDLSVTALAGMQILKHLESEKGIGSRKTTDGLNWRYGKSPFAKYKLLIAGSLQQMQGYAVLKEYVRDGVRYGHVVDWQVPAGEMVIAQSLFDATRQEFLKAQVERLSCWALSQSSLFDLLQAGGFTDCGPSTNFGYLNLALENESILANHKIWNIYMGDSDVY
jgi:hypothetical protein